MSRALQGKRIALTGTRRLAEISKLIENQGGIPLSRPIQSTIILKDQHLEESVRKIIKSPVDWFLFTTGKGIELLLETARTLGEEERILQQLKQSQIAGRGYKAAKALKKVGVQLTVRDDDGTTNSLIHQLAQYNLQNRRVFLQLHGDSASELIDALAQQGALIEEFAPYLHVPASPELTHQLVREILGGEVDAVTFTNGTQVKFIFQHAREIGRLSDLQQSFANQTIAVAVGKYTAKRLVAEGITRVVLPERERIGSMIISLATQVRKEPNYVDPS